MLINETKGHILKIEIGFPDVRMELQRGLWHSGGADSPECLPPPHTPPPPWQAVTRVGKKSYRDKKHQELVNLESLNAECHNQRASKMSNRSQEQVRMELSYSRGVGNINCTTKKKRIHRNLEWTIWILSFNPDSANNQLCDLGKITSILISSPIKWKRWTLCLFVHFFLYVDG